MLREEDESDRGWKQKNLPKTVSEQATRKRRRAGTNILFFHSTLWLHLTTDLENSRHPQPNNTQDDRREE